jgi:hypothetical protein
MAILCWAAKNSLRGTAPVTFDYALPALPLAYVAPASPPLTMLLQRTHSHMPPTPVLLHRIEQNRIFIFPSTTEPHMLPSATTLQRKGR